ncbi:MAG: hypothetical protein GWN58_52275 [Anaerolineae bacterium]|nr:hypothetical protein [Anaerolineae bacterium]
MQSRFSFIVGVVLLASLLAGCGGKPDTGHVGPVGPVGPQGTVGAQPLNGTPPANLIVIEDTDVLVSAEHPFSDFNRIEISDAFDVTIRRGEGFQVSTRFEKTAVPYIQSEQDGKTLKFQLQDDRTYHMVNITLNVEITMPQLRNLVLRDGANVTVIGFDDFGSEVDFLSELHRE